MTNLREVREQAERLIERVQVLHPSLRSNHPARADFDYQLMFLATLYEMVAGAMKAAVRGDSLLHVREIGRAFEASDLSDELRAEFAKFWKVLGIDG